MDKVEFGSIRPSISRYIERKLLTASREHSSVFLSEISTIKFLTGVGVPFNSSIPARRRSFGRGTQKES